MTAGERTDRDETAADEPTPDTTVGSTEAPAADEPAESTPDGEEPPGGTGPAPDGTGPAEDGTEPADGATEPAEDGTESDGARPGGRRRRLLVPVLAGLLLVLVLAGAVLVGLGWWSTARAADDRREIVEVSSRVVNDFITIGADNARQRSDDMLAVAAEPFRTELGRFSEVFGKILVQGKVSTEGTIDAVGIERADDDTAVVLVSASTTVRNSEIPGGAKRDFRMLLTLAHEEGSWKVSTVEVAP